MVARAHPEQDRPKGPPVRVLVAFEDARGVYGEAIARALAGLRPDLEVQASPLAEIGRALRGFDPHVVVSSKANDGHPEGRGAWVQVPTDDPGPGAARPARICFEGELWETEGPTLGEMLEVVDEARRRLRCGPLTGAC